MTKADEFKAKRKADYADPAEFFRIMGSVDPFSFIRQNEAGNIEVMFSDGSTYVIGTNG